MSSTFPCGCLVNDGMPSEGSFFSGGAMVSQIKVHRSPKHYFNYCTNCIQEEKDHRELEGKLSICGKCLTTYYCNRDCQKSNWPEHKKVCIKTSEDSLETFDESMEVITKVEKWLAEILLPGETVHTNMHIELQGEAKFKRQDLIEEKIRFSKEGKTDSVFLTSAFSDSKSLHRNKLLTTEQNMFFHTVIKCGTKEIGCELRQFGLKDYQYKIRFSVQVTNPEVVREKVTIRRIWIYTFPS